MEGDQKGTGGESVGDQGGACGESVGDQGGAEGGRVGDRGSTGSLYQREKPVSCPVHC
jgi:hypothetical protein